MRAPSCPCSTTVHGELRLSETLHTRSGPQVSRGPRREPRNAHRGSQSCRVGHEVSEGRSGGGGGRPRARRGAEE
eukprot:5285082-Pyramimonas_sp.AAC.1